MNSIMFCILIKGETIWFSMSPYCKWKIWLKSSFYYKLYTRLKLELIMFNTHLNNNFNTYDNLIATYEIYYTEFNTCWIHLVEVMQEWSTAHFKPW